MTLTSEPLYQFPTGHFLNETYNIVMANGQVQPQNEILHTGNNETAEKCEKSVDIANKRTNEMTYFMDDLSLNSPRDRQSRSRSKTYSVKQRSSSRSLSSSQSDSSSSSSSSRSRSRSHSRERRYKNTKSRSSSRSYSRDRSRSYSKSHSRSYSPRERRRYSSAYRRYYRSPPRYRSRSRSYSRYASRHRSHYSRSRSRSSGRRFYGFVRRPYSPTFRSYKSRSRTRSRSRTPLRLSLKEKQELLEIAKANASKALGKTIELPESLKKDLKNEQSRKAEDVKNCDRSRNSREFFWLFQKSNKNPKKIQEKLRDVKPKSPYMLWRPVTSEAKLFSNGLSPKRSTTSRSR